MDMTDREILFLSESNKIEGEGPDALPDSINAWQLTRDIRVITLQDILNCHSVLMRTRKNFPSSARGKLSTVQTWFLTKRYEKKLNPAPKEIPGLIATWVDDVNKNIDYWMNYDGHMDEDDQWLNQASDIRDYHVRFEKIHPFQDGNGRVGRILMNWHALRLNETGLGGHMDVIKDSEKEAYYRWFK